MCKNCRFDEADEIDVELDNPSQVGDHFMSFGMNEVQRVLADHGYKIVPDVEMKDCLNIVKELLTDCIEDVDQQDENIQRSQRVQFILAQVLNSLPQFDASSYEQAFLNSSYNPIPKQPLTYTRQ